MYRPHAQLITHAFVVLDLYAMAFNTDSWYLNDSLEEVYPDKKTLSVLCGWDTYAYAYRYYEADKNNTLVHPIRV